MTAETKPGAIAPMTDNRAGLKPCPFCGNPPEIFPSGEGGRGTMIQCCTSGCVNPHTSYYGDGVAEKHWNTRAADAGVRGSEWNAAIEAAAIAAEHPRFSHVTRLDVFKGPDWTDETGMAALVCSHARMIAASIRTLLRTEGE